MASLPLHILKAVWQARRIAWFWPIWLLMTVVGATGVWWVVGQAATATVENDKDDKDMKEAAIARMLRSLRSRGAVAGLMAVVMLLMGYVASSLVWEDFADYDDSFCTLFTLRGQNLAPTIYRAAGRFYPLGYQEFNLIRHFTDSVAGYHAVAIAQLLIVCCILFLLQDELSVTARAGLMALFLILPSVVTSFTGLVFPERNVVFWIVCLVFFIKLFEQTRSSAYAVSAAICAQIMIYYKETASPLLIGFAVGRLILRCRRADREGWDFGRLGDKESRLDLCLISLGLVFFLFYAVVMIPHPNMRYADAQRFPIRTAFLYYLRLDLLAWVFAAVVPRRAYLILRRRVAPAPLWDGLALGGVVYFLAYLYLRLCFPYYLAPVDLIAVLYVGRLAILSWEEMHLWSRAGTVVLLGVVLVQGVSLSAFRVFERKNVTHAKAELATAIASQSDANRVQRLFFLSRSKYIITEFASYLVYRGLRVEGEGSTAGSDNVVIVSKDLAKDELCLDYRNFVCHAGNTGPAPGDLVIELPDDIESQSEINSYRKGGELLFSYEPRPRVQQWMYPMLNCLRVVSFRFRFRELPDRWLHASITRWE